MNDKYFSGADNMSLQDVDENSELIPLMTPEDEQEIQNEDLPKTVSLLPKTNTVIFPGVVLPITANDEKSVRLIKDVNDGDKVFGIVYSYHKKSSTFSTENIAKIGTLVRILRILKMPDGNITVIVQGKKRFEIDTITQKEPYPKATIKETKDTRPANDNQEFVTIVESIKELALRMIKNNPNIPSEASFAIKNIESNSFLINFVSSNLNIKDSEKQKILEIANIKDRALKTLKHMNTEFQKLELKNNIQSRVRQDLDQQQREYFLHQQIKTIQEELGDLSYGGEELEEIKKRASNKKWSAEIKKHFNKEFAKLQKMNPQIAEYGVQRNYLELLLDLPFEKYSKDKLDLKRAERILNKNHYGLEDVKKRILEYLAVLKLRKDMKSPILCFYGPPGVGKTSLGKSIAKAIGREYVRISLGGLRDEAEIRGHRKTYIGAMPGRIIQSVKKAGTSNPVFVLDEIDKVGNNHTGDVSSAMLEVLDPEQNNDFYDNFLEIGYDLSKVMFIATSNNLASIQPPLRDRMEIVEVSGYTIEEKVQIAKHHLLPKLLKEHGLKNTHLKIDIRVLSEVVDGYTRESGVRGLEKQLARIIRHIAKKVVLEEEYNPKITSANLKEILGVPKLERGKYENNSVAGVVTGLAWTSVGGDILFIESSLSKGSGKLNITGNLGKVMKESAVIALEYIKANASVFNIKPEIFEKYDVHIHVPEGATPKDGPSAGITILTSLTSLFSQKKVKKSIAMTGEITLRGKVLPVGGIKEKILAAKRAGIKEIILCKENKKDIDEINTTYLKGLKFSYVVEMKEVIDLAILKQKVNEPKLL